MELIEGEKLSELLSRERLPLSRALELATEVAEGLSRAHEKRIVHRDLKPANLMVTRDGHIKIIDFGLAKLVEPLGRASAESEAQTGFKGHTHPGQVMGTVSYMSPEQARGRDVDSRSDIFTFGVVLYEMVTGELAFHSVRDGKTRVWSVAVKGGDAEPLTKRAAAISCWSPEREKNSSTHRMAICGSSSSGDGMERQLTDFSGRPGFLDYASLERDGRDLFFGWYEDLGDIWVVDVESEN